MSIGNISDRGGGDAGGSGEEEEEERDLSGGSTGEDLLDDFDDDGGGSDDSGSSTTPDFDTSPDDSGSDSTDTRTRGGTAGRGGSRRSPDDGGGTGGSSSTGDTSDTRTRGGTAGRGGSRRSPDDGGGAGGSSTTSPTQTPGETRDTARSTASAELEDRRRRAAGRSGPEPTRREIVATTGRSPDIATDQVGEQREREQRADERRRRREATIEQNSNDDLPRLSELTGRGDSDFRSQSRSRNAAQLVQSIGEDAGQSAGDTVTDVLGIDGSQEQVIEGIGRQAGGTPGSIGLLLADGPDATRSVASTAVDEGPAAGAGQAADIAVDAGDSVLGGVDRTFDIDFSRREAGEGAAIQFNTANGRGEQTAASLFTGAAFLGLSGPAGVAGRGLASRAGSAASRAGSGARSLPGSVRSLADDTRAQAQMGRQRPRGDSDSGDFDGGGEFDSDPTRPPDAGGTFDDVRQDSLTQTQDSLRSQARREREAGADLVDEPGGGDPLGTGGNGLTFDPDRPDPLGPTRPRQSQQAGQQVPRGFADIDRAGNVPTTDLRSLVEAPSATSSRFQASGASASAGASSASLIGDVDPVNDPTGISDTRGVGTNRTDPINDVTDVTGVGQGAASATLAETNDPSNVQTSGGGVGVDDNLSTETGVDVGTGGLGDINDPTDITPDTGSATDTAPTSRTDQATGPTTGQRTGGRPGQEPRTQPPGNRPQSRTQPSGFGLSDRQTRSSLRVRPPTSIGRPDRPRDFPDFGERDTGQSRGSGFSFGDFGTGRGDGGPAAGFLAETLTAFGTGGFRERRLASGVDTSFATGELPTETLANPTDDEEEAFEEVNARFFGILGDSSGDEDAETESSGGGLLNFGGAL